MKRVSMFTDKWTMTFIFQKIMLRALLIDGQNEKSSVWYFHCIRQSDTTQLGSPFWSAV